jgi:hypothetical protein
MITQERLRKAAQFLMLALTIWALFVTLMRGIRLPNDFAETHWLIDYSFGFIKRGLIGSLMSLLSRSGVLLLTEANIIVLSFAAFSLFCLALLALSWRILLKSSWGVDAFLVVVVFATSPFVVMSAHLMGYFDNILILLTLASAWLVLKDRSWLAGGLMALAVLIHESVMLIGLPLLILTIYLKANQIHGRRLSLKPFLPLLLPILIFFALVLSEAFFVDRGQLQALLTERFSNYEFIQERRNILVPRWLTRSLFTHLKSESPKFLDRLTDTSMLLAMLPSIITILAYVLYKFRVRLLSIETLLIAMVTFTPLLMHAIAWDTERIWSYSIFAAFVVVWTYCEVVPLQKVRDPSWLVFVALPALVSNIFVRIPLMDNLVERYTNNTRLVVYAPLLFGTTLVLLFILLRERLSGWLAAKGLPPDQEAQSIDPLESQGKVINRDENL